MATAKAVNSATEEPTCTICQAEQKAILSDYFCRDCVTYLCYECETAHRQKAVSRDHDVEVITAGNIQTYCVNHSDNPALYWCAPCCSAICFVCYVKSHEDHEMKTIKHHLSDLACKVKTSMDDAVRYKYNHLHHKKVIEKLAEKLEKVYKRTIKDINQHCTKLIKSILSKKKALIATLTKTFNHKIENMKNDIALQNKHIQEIEKCVTKNSDVVAYKNFSTGLDDMEKLLYRTEKILFVRPVEIPTPDFLAFSPESSLKVGELNSHLKLLIQKPVWQTSVTDEFSGVGDICFVTSKTLAVAYDGGLSFYVSHGDRSTYRLSYRTMEDAGHDICGVSTSTRPDILYLSCGGRECKTVHRYSISKRRIVRSRRHWPCKVFGSPLGIQKAGCGHFVVCDWIGKRVSVHRSNGEVLVKLCDKDNQVAFRRPFYVTTSDNNVFVTDIGQFKVYVFDMNGQFRYDLDQHNNNTSLKLSSPWGLCKEQSGNILLADYTGNKVVKFDCHGNYMSAVVTDRSVDIHKPLCVTFRYDDNKYLLGVFEESGTVKVFHLSPS